LYGWNHSGSGVGFVTRVTKEKPTA
jgi:hypothetical protein